VAIDGFDQCEIVEADDGLGPFSLVHAEFQRIAGDLQDVGVVQQTVGHDVSFAKWASGGPGPDGWRLSSVGPSHAAVAKSILRALCDGIGCRN